MKTLLLKTFLVLSLCLLFSGLLAVTVRPAHVSADPQVLQQIEDAHDPQKLATRVQKNPIIKDLQTIINVASAGVSLLIVGMIIYGGIRYALAGDNQNHVTSARNQIIDAVFALLVFILMYSFLQWIIPGGLFNS